MVLFLPQVIYDVEEFQAKMDACSEEVSSPPSQAPKKLAQA